MFALGLAAFSLTQQGGSHRRGTALTMESVFGSCRICIKPPDASYCLFAKPTGGGAPPHDGRKGLSLSEDPARDGEAISEGHVLNLSRRKPTTKSLALDGIRTIANPVILLRNYWGPRTHLRRNLHPGGVKNGAENRSAIAAARRQVLYQ